jgi:GAF domain-containing protein
VSESGGTAPLERAALLDGLSLAAVAVDLGGDITYLNPAAESRFGSGPHVRVGYDVRAGIFPESMHGAVQEVLQLVQSSGAWVGELSMVGADGGAVLMSTSWTAFEQDGLPAGALILVEAAGALGAQLSPLAAGDAMSSNQPRPQARRLQRFSSVIDELLVSDSIDAVAKVVTQHMTDAAGATVGSISLLVDDDTLALVGLRGGAEGAASRWATYSVHGHTPAAETVRTGEPVVLVGREEIERRYPDLELAAEGERSIVCLPLMAAGGRRLGVVTMSFPGRWRVDEPESLFLRLLADTCAMTVDRLQAQRDAEDREAKLRFLAETSTRLVGDLDYESTLVAVAEAAVPWFADWCSIALEEDGLLRTLSVAHANPEMVAFVEELQTRYPPEPDPERGAYKVLRTGASELFPDIPDELLELAAKDEEHLRLLRMLELRSGLSCALKVRGRVLGVITWASSGERARRFTRADQSFGEDLAQRAAVAIDNAQLHTQVRDVALELQRAVLPDELPEPNGWTTAVQYLPAGRTDAGGDFYDVVPLADGRVAAFVGDVMGRGVQAASVMVQMRSAIRTLVAVDPTPAAVLSGMDRVFETLHLDQLVTMVYALADPGLDSVAVINAGHPEPMLIRASGEVEALSVASTLILGAGGGHRSVLTTDLLPGDALFLYTDGLVERRVADNDAALARLLASMRRPDGDPATWLARVVEEVRDPTRDDDVAALLVARHA